MNTNELLQKLQSVINDPEAIQQLIDQAQLQKPMSNTNALYDQVRKLDRSPANFRQLLAILKYVIGELETQGVDFTFAPCQTEFYNVKSDIDMNELMRLLGTVTQNFPGIRNSKKSPYTPFIDSLRNSTVIEEVEEDGMDVLAVIDTNDYEEDELLEEEDLMALT
jgi:hypothetical protein